VWTLWALVSSPSRELSNAFHLLVHLYNKLGAYTRTFVLTGLFSQIKYWTSRIHETLYPDDGGDEVRNGFFILSTISSAVGAQMRLMLSYYSHIIAFMTILCEEFNGWWGNSLPTNSTWSVVNVGVDGYLFRQFVIPLQVTLLLRVDKSLPCLRWVITA